MHYERQRDEYTISTDKALLDRPVIHAFLATAYWSPGVSPDIVDRALDHSLVFGLYKGTEQAGMARVITDYTTFGYVADVFILPHFRGQGLGVWLVESVLLHPELKGFRRWLLATLDAHGLYHKHGFKPLAHPERFLEIWHNPMLSDDQ